MLRRPTTAVLGLALLSTWSHVPALHIHSYRDHGHAEHRHGPAAHGHDHTLEADVSDDRAHIKGCNPALHVLSVAFVSAAPPQSHATAEPVAPAILTSCVRECATAAVFEVRAHGPPGLTRLSPRAPPAELSA